jgi:hypothetical protein
MNSRAREVQLPHDLPSALLMPLLVPIAAAIASKKGANAPHGRSLYRRFPRL